MKHQEPQILVVSATSSSSPAGGLSSMANLINKAFEKKFKVTSIYWVIINFSYVKGSF